MPATQRLTAEQIQYLNAQRVSRFATVDSKGTPHLVPLCHAATETAVYVSNGPRGRQAKRVRNLMENPRAAFLVDHYSEDWDRIGYVMVSGRVDLLTEGPELAEAVLLLKARYEQWHNWPLEEWGVAALRVEQVVTR